MEIKIEVDRRNLPAANTASAASAVHRRRLLGRIARMKIQISIEQRVALAIIGLLLALLARVH